MTKNQTEECAKVCNELLRGEISAVETYQQALDKLEDEAEVTTLRAFLGDHQQSVTKLSASVRSMGGVPSQESGAWGTFARAVEGTAKLFGNRAAVAALKQGEEKGLGDYEDALDNSNVAPECKDMIQNDLLPLQRDHIAVLDEIEAGL